MSTNRLVTDHPGERLNELLNAVIRRNARLSVSGEVPERHQRELRGLYALRDGYEGGQITARQLDNIIGALLAYAKEPLS